MNEEKINQILKNQIAIMYVLYYGDEERSSTLLCEHNATVRLLNPKEDSTISEKTKDALSEDRNKFGKRSK